VTHIGFGFAIFFASLSGGGSSVRHVVSLPGANLLQVMFFVSFYCWRRDDFFSSSDLDLGGASTDAGSFSWKASGNAGSCSEKAWCRRYL
jgi:hypothetical protein